VLLDSDGQILASSDYRLATAEFHRAGRESGLFGVDGDNMVPVGCCADKVRDRLSRYGVVIV
jgi:hypothetical protein